MGLSVPICHEHRNFVLRSKTDSAQTVYHVASDGGRWILINWGGRGKNYSSIVRKRCGVAQNTTKGVWCRYRDPNPASAEWAQCRSSLPPPGSRVSVRNCGLTFLYVGFTCTIWLSRVKHSRVYKCRNRAASWPPWRLPSETAACAARLTVECRRIQFGK
jgi:hypothetical protein